MNKILLFVFGGVLILLGYFFLKGNPYKVWSCNQKGGRWMKLSYPVVPRFSDDGYCFYPSKDEGKPCYSNSECEKDCVVSPSYATDEEGFLKGTCGVYSIFDCAPTIPYKTKDRKILMGGSCV